MSGLWFEGEIADAISKARSEKKILTVFIQGDDDNSKEIVNHLDNLEDDTCNMVKNEMICLRIENESENSRHFGNIYRITEVPSLFFISTNGLVINVLHGLVSSDELKKSIEKAINDFRALNEEKEKTSCDSTDNEVKNDSNSSKKSPIKSEQEKKSESIEKKPTDDNGSSLSQQKENEDKSNESSKKDVNDEKKVGESLVNESHGKESNEKDLDKKKKEKIEKALKQVREKKKKEDEEHLRQTEKKRIEVSKNLQDAKLELERRQAEELIKEREKSKREEKIAREEILKLIEFDKQERKRKFPQDNSQRCSTTQQQQKSNDSSPSTTAIKTNTGNKSSESNHTMTRIQFRLQNGATMTQEFHRDDPLCAARQYVLDMTNLKKFSLVTTFPKRIFNNEHMTKSLHELNLTPSAVLLIIPDKDNGLNSSAISQSYLGRMVLMFFFPFIFIWSFISQYFGVDSSNRIGGGGGSSSGDPTLLTPTTKFPVQTKRKPTPEKEKEPKRRRSDSSTVKKDGNFHRLGNDEDGDDDSTYNGNTTMLL